MGKFGDSARELGHRFGVNGDVMNVALRNAGILEGEPGAWRTTPAAEQWVTAREFTNGRHPDARQNPYFPVRQFKPEMLDHIGLTANDIAVAQLEVSAKRAAQSAQLKVDRAQADADFLATQKHARPEADAVGVSGADMNAKAVLVVAGVVVGVGLATYLIVKHVPPVRRRWDKSVAPRLARWAERYHDEVSTDSSAAKADEG